MKNLSYSFLLFFALAFLACEKEIPFPEQESKPKLVLNSAFSLDSTWSVHISESIPVSQSGDPKNLTTATVNLLDESGTLISKLEHTENGFYQASNLKPEAGKQYKIEASASGFETATAEGMQPSTFNYSLVDTSRGNFLDFPVIFIDLDIDDDASEENYYFIQAELYIEFPDVDTLESYTYVPTHFVFDQNTENSEISTDNSGYERIFLPDRTFNGEKYQTRLAIEHLQELNTGEFPFSVILSVSSVDPGLYKYTKSLDRYYNNNDDLFSEPVQIFNNIQNGLGVFGGFTTKQIEIKFE